MYIIINIVDIVYIVYCNSLYKTKSINFFIKKINDKSLFHIILQI